MECLIAGGADVNVATENMNTPLMVASALGYLECVNKLIDAGAQVNKCNIFGWKALHFAVHGGYADIVIGTTCTLFFMVLLRRFLPFVIVSPL